MRRIAGRWQSRRNWNRCCGCCDRWQSQRDGSVVRFALLHYLLEFPIAIGRRLGDFTTAHTTQTGETDVGDIVVQQMQQVLLLLVQQVRVFDSRLRALRDGNVLQQFGTHRRSIPVDRIRPFRAGRIENVLFFIQIVDADVQLSRVQFTDIAGDPFFGAARRYFRIGFWRSIDFGRHQQFIIIIGGNMRLNQTRDIAAMLNSTTVMG